MTNRRYFVESIAVSALLVGRLVAAETTKPPRVAFVLTAVPAADIAGPDPVDPYTRAFLRGMRDQGLVDGRDVRVVLRTAEGNLNRFDALMREMVELDVKVIVTFSDAVPAAQRASRTIAIVALTGDPIAMGIADSLAHPGHNVTGIGSTGFDFFLKKLQLLKEAAPRITRVAELSFRPLPGSSDAADEIATAAAAKKRLGLDLLILRAETPQELETAFEQLAVDRVDALYADYNSFNFANRHRIAALAVRHHLPSTGMPDCAMLLNYASDTLEAVRHMATFVKRILDGAKPGDLPFERPTIFKLTINLTTAREVGLTIPQSLLVRADEIVQ